jgi:hypothetical protein
MSVLAVCLNVFGDSRRARLAVYIMGPFCTAQSLAAVLVSCMTLNTNLSLKLTINERTWYSNARLCL